MALGWNEQKPRCDEDVQSKKYKQEPECVGLFDFEEGGSRDNWWKLARATAGNELARWEEVEGELSGICLDRLLSIIDMISLLETKAREVWAW